MIIFEIIGLLIFIAFVVIVISGLIAFRKQ